MQGAERKNLLLQGPANIGKLASHQNAITSKLLTIVYDNLEKYGITVAVLIFLVPNVMCTRNKFFDCIYESTKKTTITHIYTKVR